MGKRYDASYDRGEQDVTLAWRVGEGEEVIISISQGEWQLLPLLLLLLLPLAIGLRKREVPFVWARNSRAYL